MPRSGAYLLHEYPHKTVRIACRKCPRRGQYHKVTLIERYGGDISLPDLLSEIAKDCSKTEHWDRCGAHYADEISQ